MELERTPTKLSMPDVVRVLAAAHRSERGSKPHRNLVALAAAIVALENARGHAILWYNYGNISWVGQTPHWWAHPKPSTGQPTRFAVYNSHEDGARAWWRLMFKRYRGVLSRGLAADPRGAVLELYRAGYVVGPPAEREQYARAVVGMFDEALGKWVPSSGVYSDPLAPVILAAGLAAAFSPLLARWFS